MNPQPRRVLHLVGAAEDNGGILSTIRGIASAGDASRWEHVLWMNSAFRQTRQPLLPCRFSPHALDETPSHLRFLLAAWKAWPDLRQLLASETFQVVHAHSRGSLPLAWRLARRRHPVLFTNHAYARRTGLYRAAARVPGLLNVLLTPNQARHYDITPEPGRVEIVSECGANRFFESEIHARPPAANRPLELVGIGNIVPWKKWHLLLDALQRLPAPIASRLHLTIWGPIPNDDACRKYSGDLHAAALKHNLQARFQLAGPTHDVDRVLAHADWFVLPSTNEPCSVALIEALASGVPGLVSASGGNLDIVRPGTNGAHFTPDSADSLAARLTEIAEGRLDLKPSPAIRATVIDRSARNVATRYESLYALCAGLDTPRGAST